MTLKTILPALMASLLLAMQCLSPCQGQEVLTLDSCRAMALSNNKQLSVK
jgi:hypothetical protein